MLDRSIDNIDLKMATETTNKQEFLLRVGILSLICCIAFFTRLFSVLRFESVIHEVPTANAARRLALALAVRACGLSHVRACVRAVSHTALLSLPLL